MKDLSTLEMFAARGILVNNLNQRDHKCILPEQQ
jgi:hypothetical protein